MIAPSAAGVAEQLGAEPLVAPARDAAALGVDLDPVDAVVEHVRPAARPRAPRDAGREPEHGDAVGRNLAGLHDDVGDRPVARCDVPGARAAVGTGDPEFALEPSCGRPKRASPARAQLSGFTSTTQSVSSGAASRAM